MPKLTVEGFPTVEVEAGKRLVLAIEQDAHVDVLHACGGNARCTTCRVEFIDGEPTRSTVAERQVLAAKGVTGVRLSCQIVCDHDMTVRAISRLDRQRPARSRRHAAARHQSAGRLDVEDCSSTRLRPVRSRVAPALRRYRSRMRGIR